MVPNPRAGRNEHHEGEPGSPSCVYGNLSSAVMCSRLAAFVGESVCRPRVSRLLDQQQFDPTVDALKREVPRPLDFKDGNKNTSCLVDATKIGFMVL